MRSLSAVHGAYSRACHYLAAVYGRPEMLSLSHHLGTGCANHLLLLKP
jgi:hypothetical protein